MLRCIAVMTRLSLALMVFCGLLNVAHSQITYPTKGLRIVVPFAPGGATDILARMAAQHLTQVWAQPVVVENKPGAGGNIGADAGAKAATDGYTLTLAAAGFMAVNPSMYTNLTYNSVTDISPVILLVKAPLLLVVNPAVQAQSLSEFIELARRNPGKINLGNGGTGTAQHLGGVSFSLAANIELNHVPYKGSAPATTDLLGGTVDAQFDNMVTLVPYVKSGKLRALAVSSLQRVAAMPDVPPMAERGLPGFETGTWYGIVAPKNTPIDIVDKLNIELRKMLTLPEVKDKLAAMGLEASANTPAEFSALIRSEIVKYAAIVKSAKISAN
jgi:tripartite-type tricarboxylate transporter receptor subunit TctC